MIERKEIFHLLKRALEPAPHEFDHMNTMTHLPAHSARDSILIVDDELRARENAADTVRAAGYACETSEDGFEALEMIDGADFSLIVSDLEMPKLNGLQLLRKARVIRPHLPFIIMTERKAMCPHEAVFKAGATDLIGKPFTETEIKRTLGRIARELRLYNENKRLMGMHDSMMGKLSSLLQISHDLIAEMNMDRVFEIIVDRVSEVMEAERTSLYIIDWENREIWTKVAQQIGQIRLPLGKGISGHVAETGETINIDDAWKSPLFCPEYDLKHGYRTRSVLCAPIVNREGKRIGALQVLNKRKGNRFDRNDELILEAINSQVAIALENSFLLEELQVSFERSIRTLAATVDAKHPLTAGHSQRVADFSLTIGRELGLEDSDLEVIKYAGLLHDIGKIGIPDEVLLKRGAFTDPEREIMKTHAFKTRTILENFHFPRNLETVPLIASQHHEKMDGQGYPDGLTGKDLPLGARILAVADVFDALTSKRDYSKYAGDKTMGRGPMPLVEAVGIIKKEAGVHFDAQVVEAFLRRLPEILNRYRGEHFDPEYVDEAAGEFFKT